MAFQRSSSVRPAITAEAIRRNLETPRNRATAARLLNRESEKVKAICEEIAEADLHRRPDNRRSAESLAHGAEYHDSFEIVPANQGDGLDNMEVRVRNTHPAAHILEFGADPHAIPASSAPDLVFPYKGSGLGGRVGSKGTFAVNWGGAIRFQGKSVDHPGVEPRRIMRRAMQRYRD